MEHSSAEQQSTTARPARKRRRTKAVPSGDAVPTFAERTVEPRPKVTAPAASDQAPPNHSAPQQPHSLRHNAQQAGALAQELAKEVVLPQRLAHLGKTYCFATLSILSSSKIEQKARSLLRHLARFSFLDRNPKPGVVILHAKRDVANKLISVVEIAKRDIEGQKGQWWQYSRISGELVEKQGKKKETNEDVKAATRRKWGQNENHAVDAERQKEQGAADQEMADSTDDASGFETMRDKTETDLRPKKQMVPTMTIYMSRVTIPEFKEEFGYVETHGSELKLTTKSLGNRQTPEPKAMAMHSPEKLAEDPGLCAHDLDPSINVSASARRKFGNTRID